MEFVARKLTVYRKACITSLKDERILVHAREFHIESKIMFTRDIKVLLPLNYLAK